jgi:hypothetical protein
VANRPDGSAEAARRPRPGEAQRVMAAMLKMKKIEIGELEAAAA